MVHSPVVKFVGFGFKGVAGIIVVAIVDQTCLKLFREVLVNDPIDNRGGNMIRLECCTLLQGEYKCLVIDGSGAEFAGNDGVIVAIGT